MQADARQAERAAGEARGRLGNQQQARGARQQACEALAERSG